MLRTVQTPARALPQAIISRVKIMAGLNIAERRLPQDGAARQSIRGAEVDIRVATMPTQYGKSAVMRLLPKDRGLFEIGKLGILHADEAKITRLLALPHGMIVITGPTGSGKTTTLATMLSILNDTSRKMLTMRILSSTESPVSTKSQVEAGDRTDFRDRTARIPSSRSRRDHGRRGARCRDRPYCNSRRTHRPPRADDLAY